MKMMKRFAAAMLALTMVFGLCNFSASAVGHVDGVMQTKWDTDSATIKWNTYAAAKDYAVFIGNMSNGSDLTYKTDSSSPNDVRISGLSVGGTFYVQVRAYDEWISETKAKRVAPIAVSDVIAITTLPETPAKPDSVIQTGATANTVTLTWSAVANVTGYEVRQYVDYNNEPVVADVPASQGTSAVIGGLTYNVSNRYNVYSYVIAPNGQKVYSSGYAYLWGTKTLPRAYASGEFGISYLWTGLKETDFRASSVNSNADDYVFQVKNKKTNKTVFTGKDLKMTGTTKNKFLKYRVRGYININNGQSKAYGPYSGYKYFAWMEGLGARRVGKKRAVKVSWKKVQGATGYDIRISTSKEGGYKKVKSISAKSNSVVVSKYGKKALKKNHTYYILITPKTKVGKKTVKSEAKWYAQVTFY